MSTDHDIAAAERLLGRLSELSPDLRAAALFDSAGGLIAASGEDAATGWEAAAHELWGAVDVAVGGEARQLHVGTEDGEVFGVRGPAASVLAVSNRFALASLMLCDLRAVLRDLEREGG